MNIRISAFSLLILIASGSTLAVAEPPPAPAPFQPFNLPLSNKTSASAVILPIDADHTWMVYATRDGQIGFWMMSKQARPIPPGPTPPVPPPLEKLTIAIIEDPSSTSTAQRQVLADLTWRKRAAEQHNFLGLIPSDLRDARTGLPPANLLPFLEHAKLHALPYIIMYDHRGAITWEGPLPATAAKLLDLIPNLERKKDEPTSDNQNRLAPPPTRSSQKIQTSRSRTLSWLSISPGTLQRFCHAEGMADGNANHSPRCVAATDRTREKNFPFQSPWKITQATRSRFDLQMLGPRIGQGVGSSSLMGGTNAIDAVARFDCLSNRRNQRSRWLPWGRLPAIKPWRRLPIVCVA